MNITVYLGANEGNDPALHKAVTELGAWIGQSGNGSGWVCRLDTVFLGIR